MRKYLNAGMAAVLALSLAACANKKEESTATATPEPTEEAAEDTIEKAVYTIYNATGERVTELTLTDNATGEVSENFAEGGMKNWDSFDIEIELPKSQTEEVSYTLSFTTAGGYTGKFDTLHFEVAPIALIAEDAMTGATQIAFAVPEVAAEYTIYNVTGEDVTELYVAEEGEDKVNYAEEPLHDGEVLTLTMPAEKLSDIDDIKYVLEFTTASGYTGTFETLSYEVAPISLLAEDALTGPTQISFTKPE